MFYNNNNNNGYPSNHYNDDSVSYTNTTTKMMSSNPENYLTSFAHRKVLGIADNFYDRLLKIAVNNTIYTVKATQTNAIETK